MSAVPRTASLLLQAVLSGRYTFCVLLAPVLLAFGVFFNSRLQSLNLGWLEWSPFHVKANVALLPIKARLVWLPYALLLAFCMPFFALIEEILFRAGTTDWVRGLLWGTLAFGLCHLISFVTIRMTIYLTLVGAVFVQLYMLDGLVAVFVLHSVYNLTALALVVAARKRGLRGLSDGPPPLRRGGRA
jgi:Type II CAAX prenyl endopeptidase Rce1-like